MDWIVNNIEVLFSGFGGGLVIFLLGLFFYKKCGVKQTMKNSHGSTQEINIKKD